MVKKIRFFHIILASGILVWLVAASIGIMLTRSDASVFTELLAYSLAAPVLVVSFFYGRSLGLATALFASLVIGSLGVGQPDTLESPLVQRVLFQIVFLNAIALAIGSLAEREREAKSYLQTVQDTALMGYVLIEAGIFRIVEINQYAANMIGLPREEIIGRTCHGFICPYGEDDCPMEAAVPLEHQSEQQLLTADGKIIPIHKTVTPIILGEQKYYIESFLDLSERVEAEQVIRDSEERLNLVLQGADLGFWDWNIETGEIIVNQRWAEMLGYKLEDIEPNVKTWEKLVHPDDLPNTMELLQKHLDGEAPSYESEHRLMRKDGGWSWVLDRGRVLMWDDQGKPLRATGTHLDISERKQAEEKIRQQIQRLDVLRSIDTAIIKHTELRTILELILANIIPQLEVDAAAILLYNETTQELSYGAGRGFRSQVLQHTHLHLGKGLAGRAALERCMLYIDNLTKKNSFLDSPDFQDEGFESYIGIPLIVQEKLKGVLEIFTRFPFSPSPEWEDFLEALAAQAALSIDNTSLFESLQHANKEIIRSYDATLEGWARALELRDMETSGHTQRVVQLTLRLAQAMGIEGEQLEILRRGALLHDIGKMAISDRILQKPGELSPEEWKIMRQHPVHAYNVLSPIRFLKPALDIPYCHHEKWDGTGYPRGLKGEDIPLSARIFAVVDVWDAVTSDRVYRRAWSKERARDYIQEQSGRHFDPQVVVPFLELLDEDKE